MERQAHLGHVDVGLFNTLFLVNYRGIEGKNMEEREYEGKKRERERNTSI